MTEAERLAALKVDLGITATAYDERLKQYLSVAAENITNEGVALDYSRYDHNQIVIMYAAWMWRKRESGQGMPRMVRYQLNNLIFRDKMAGE